MDFAIKEEARDWFKGIRQDLVALSGERVRSSPDFDAFYFCFVAGLAKKRKIEASKTIPITENFPGPYSERGRLLIALFLIYELEYLGIRMNEKKTVHDKISELVDPNTPNFLSDEGVREFNKFAHGGYEVLSEWFTEQPQSLEVFLRTFNKKIREIQRSSEEI